MAIIHIPSLLYRSEVFIIILSFMIRAVNLTQVWIAIPIIMFVVSSVYVSIGNELSPRVIFTSLSLLITIRLTSVHFFVLCTLYVSEAMVAVKRITVRMSLFLQYGGREGGREREHFLALFYLSLGFPPPG